MSEPARGTASSYEITDVMPMKNTTYMMTINSAPNTKALLKFFFASFSSCVIDNAVIQPSYANAVNATDTAKFDALKGEDVAKLGVSGLMPP